MKAPRFLLVGKVKSCSKIAKPISSLIIILALGLNGCTQDKTDVEYLESAKKYAAEGDYKSYSIELKNALQQNPENAEARFLLGQFYVANQLGAPAEKELNRAIEYGARKSAVTKYLVQAYFFQYQYKELLEATSTLPEETTAEDTAEIYFYRAVSNINLNNVDDAQKEFDAATNAAPDSLYGKLSQGYLYLIFDKPATAEEIGAELVKSSPDDAEVHLLLSRAKLALEKPVDAANHMAQALKLQPNRLQLYVDAARLQIVANQYEDAEKNIDYVLKKAPSHLPSNIIKATLRLHAKDWEAARVHADNAINISEVNKQAKLLSGMANFYLQNWEMARDRLTAVHEFVRPGHIAQRMLSYSEFKLGYSQSADEVLENLGDLKETDTKLLATFGKEFLKKGQVDQAYSLFETAAGLNPEDSESLTRLGILKLQLSDMSGVSDLEKALEQDGNSLWTRAALAKHYLKVEDYDKATKTIEELVNANPDQVEPLLLAAEVYSATGDKGKAKKTLDKAYSINNQHIPTLIAYFKLALSEEKLQEANARLEEILKIDSANEYALITTYRLAKNEGSVERATKAIERALSNKPKQGSVKIIKAMTEVDQQNLEGALKTLESIEETSPQYIRALSTSGNIYLELGKPEKALEKYKAWTLRSPKDARAYLAMAKGHMSKEKYRDAMSVIQKGLTELPGHKDLQLAEIQVLMLLDQPEQANSKIAKFTAVYGQNAKLESYRGTYYLKKRRYKDAIKHFVNLHKLQPSSQTLITLAELYKRDNQLDKAEALLTDWLKDKPMDQAAKLYRANLNIASGSTDNSAAIEQFQAIVEQNSNNYVALNNLAWTLGQEGRLSEAVEYAEKAYNLQKNNAAIADTYGYLLLQSGDIETAEQILSQAHNQANGEPTITFHYAMVLSQAGKTEEAKALLTKLESEDFPEKEEAYKLLKTL
ncbi:XrtA/PEP-CTERM system TPR-repeat protein PrsT [Hahella ganghwensis]|uniref:XrtA/PEP-CTERM system TPR-repeat protein PrsT n=1 Tax=Hahella ganghwensis TaxID=286420 RepID=UPI00035D1F96|nr:XrtA/PEP-CTERM system TPR-repeat protein PrsT [Hahella ganghwensis]